MYHQLVYEVVFLYCVEATARLLCRHSSPITLRHEPRGCVSTAAGFVIFDVKKS